MKSDCAFPPPGPQFTGAGVDVFVLRVRLALVFE